jgi:Domain of unknown function (DUF4274)
MKAPPIPIDFDEIINTHLAKLRMIEWFEGTNDYAWLLERSTPDEWHHIALQANCDSIDPEIFQWIASRPNCEKATALVLFWMSQPEYYLTIGRDRDALNESMNPDHVTDLLKRFDMIEHIRMRWMAGGYLQSSISFDYDRDVRTSEFGKIDAEFGDLALEYLPLEMRCPLPGRQPSELSLSDDYPEEFMG